MFHLYLTLAYIIPNIYVFFRIRDLFISKGYKVYFGMFYFLLFTVYPVSEFISHREMNALISLISVIANYLLPFYLYVFLSVLLFDLFLLLNTWLHLVSDEVRRSLNFRKYVLSSIIAVSVIIVIGGIVNLNTIRYSKYSITIPRKASRLNHLRVAFVADFHIQQNSHVQFVDQFVKKINAARPDILLYGGDIIERGGEPEAVKLSLRNIVTQFGSYAVLGNHEFYSGQNKGDFFRQAGIQLLCDTIMRIDESFYIGGRFDQHFNQRKSANELLRGITPDLPILLMDHRPTELTEVSKTGTDAQFSGHTHNGQLFPINLITSAVYELSWGHKKINNTHFFVTSGLRLWGPPVKTAGKSEIMIIDIEFK